MKKNENKKAFKLIGLGGTFDHLHDGHKFLLRTAVKLGDHLAIALATEALLGSKQHKHVIESYDIRERVLCSYLEGVLGLTREKYTIIPLNDPFGSAITDPNLEAHVSSAETFETALKINEIRTQNGLNPMILVVIPIVCDAKGNKLSSTNIRSCL
ncbi:MAG: pantetheine-phosphate adenylyltransferase [Candidatus Lokiarchaeota archaeon]|nr:pantetheine-phosphate adenylyltransferase [Candidatus Lokiarchaeota archaeon]